MVSEHSVAYRIELVIIADSIIYYIIDPYTQVFKTLQSCLAIWTSLNNRV
jgi:hypothetical protein